MGAPDAAAGSFAVAARPGLRSKLSKAFLLQATAITCATILGIYAASAVLEDVLIKRALGEEAAHYLELLDQEPNHPEPNTHNMRGYLLRPGVPADTLPDDLRALQPGFQTMTTAEGQPLVYVRDSTHGRLYLRFDQQHVGDRKSVV